MIKLTKGRIMKRKICVITGTRAEYSSLYWLMKEIQNDSELELQVVVTGMHLSPEFGLTWQQVLSDGFPISKKVEMLLSSDTPVGVTKSLGLCLIGMASALDELRPDIMVGIADRYETLGACIAAMIAQIPIAHLYGGESSEGAFDEAVRHSMTKMAHIHFTASEEYRRRIIQLGEHPDSIFNVGGIGVDLINRTKLLSRSEFEKSIERSLSKKNLLITYHPVTLENNTSQEQFQELLEALDGLQDTLLIFTKPNSDTYGRVIIQMIDEYVKNNSDKSVSFVSLGLLRYLSGMQYVDAVVGNSSSGLSEAPSFKIGTINIGDRQRGRLKAESVIDCESKKDSITLALEKLYTKSFQRILKTVKNPNGEPGAAKKIKRILKKQPLSNILKKKFYDISA
ncbi:MAG: UDP-N-acetylglucosamine 2-epimerase [Candidatus Omnitrophota bacterium]